MSIMKDFLCIICGNKFDVNEYDDQNKNQCGNCGQIYNYDEGLHIELTPEQLELLKTGH